MTQANREDLRAIEAAAEAIRATAVDPDTICCFQQEMCSRPPCTCAQQLARAALAKLARPDLATLVREVLDNAPGDDAERFMLLPHALAEGGWFKRARDALALHQRPENAQQVTADHKTAIARAFDAWWRGLTRQGDPQRRTRLTEEAFEMGYNVALALNPPHSALDRQKEMRCASPSGCGRVFRDNTNQCPVCNMPLVADDRKDEP